MIIGLDIATLTGWAIYDGRDYTAIRVGSFRATGETPEHKADAVAAHLIRLLKTEGRPEIVAIEQPQRNVQQYRKQGTRMMPEAQGGLTINAGTALQLNQMVGSAVAVLRGFGVPWVTVPVQTWRKAFFPKGVKGKDRQDWKRLAKWHCEQLKIDVSNADQAEAVGIAVWAAGHCQELKLQRLAS